MTTKPFEFTVSAPFRIDSMATWTDQLRYLEDSGFHGVVMADHFTDGYSLEPMVALTAAASATSTLRLITGVLGNDYRHPVLTARMAAALDVVSEGRLTLGIGAGWMRSDYEAAGIPLDRAGVRVSRLEESLRVVSGLLAGGPFRFEGEFYDVDLEMLPTTIQQSVPLFVGGGSPRVLGIAGKYGHVVGVVASLAAGELGSAQVEDLSAERVDEKIGWIRDGAESAGRSLDDVTLEMNHWLVRVTASSSETEEFLAKMAGRMGVSADLLATSPGVLVGTLDQIADTVVERRERYGFSCLQLDAGFAPSDYESVAPIVGRLAGT